MLAPTSIGTPGNDPATARVLANRYRLLRLVGHGGMGSVYEARHVHTDKQIAVKLLSAQLSKDLKLVARFRREAMAASRLEQENCVRVDDFGEDADGTFYIAMEYVDGHGLADELRRSGAMSPERVARIGVQLLRALDAAHSAGVLHRDLKPQNVMLAQRVNRVDEVKVVDFGIAKLITNTAEDQGALTVPGTIFGTPEYMSPEQARGESLDARSDLYSAAVVLWHLVIGRSPFRGSSVRETLMKVFAEEPPALATERPDLVVPPGFEAVLRRAMSKARDDRYPDAASFLAALAPFAGASVDLPRLPLPGLGKDGAPPPITVDDQRSVTRALPLAELPPLDPLPAPAPPIAAESLLRPLTRPPLEPSHVDAREVSGGLRRPVSGTSLARAVLALAGLGLVAVGIAVGQAVTHLAAPPPPPPHVDVARAPPPPAPDAAPPTPSPTPAVERPARVAPKPAAGQSQALRAKLAEGKAAVEVGDSAAAQAAYTAALEVEPKNFQALYGAAIAAMQQNDWPVAAELLGRLRALSPKNASRFAALHERALKLAGAPTTDVPSP